MIHVNVFSHGGISLENTGHGTTHRLFVVGVTGKTIRLTHYNSFVFHTLELVF